MGSSDGKSARADSVEEVVNEGSFAREITLCCDRIDIGRPTVERDRGAPRADIRIPLTGRVKAGIPAVQASGGFPAQGARWRGGMNCVIRPSGSLGAVGLKQWPASSRGKKLQHRPGFLTNEPWTHVMHIACRLVPREDPEGDRDQCQQYAKRQQPEPSVRTAKRDDPERNQNGEGERPPRTPGAGREPHGFRATEIARAPQVRAAPTNTSAPTMRKIRSAIGIRNNAAPIATTSAIAPYSAVKNPHRRALRVLLQPDTGILIPAVVGG
jgi:hypothetical protein